jgi:hypothetical protein
LAAGVSIRLARSSLGYSTSEGSGPRWVVEKVAAQPPRPPWSARIRTGRLDS